MKQYLIGIAAITVTWFVACLVGGAQDYVRLYGIDNQTQSRVVNPLPVVTAGGVLPAQITNTTANIPSANTLVTLVAACSNITILNPLGGANLYVDFTGAGATTSSFEIPAGWAFTFTGLPDVQSFYVKGSSASGTYSVFAH